MRWGLLPWSAACLLAGGCAYDQRQPVYSEVPGTQVISANPSAHTGWNSSGAVYDTSSRAVDADRALLSRLQQELARYGELQQAARAVGMTVQSGVVTLTGSVPTQQDREMIAALVRNVSGVTRVNDQLSVSVPSATGQTSSQVYSSTTGWQSQPQAPGGMFSLHVNDLNSSDQDLARRIMDRLRNDTSLGATQPRVDITVANGRVVLDGTVSSEQQRQAIATAVENASGVAVINQLRVSPAWR